MNPIERKDLYKLLTGLSNKLNDIAENTPDVDTVDEIEELINVIDESANQLIFNRN